MRIFEKIKNGNGIRRKLGEHRENEGREEWVNAWVRVMYLHSQQERES